MFLEFVMRQSEAINTQQIQNHQETQKEVGCRMSPCFQGTTAHSHQIFLFKSKINI